MGYICIVPQYVENSKKLNSADVLTDQATFDTITKTSQNVIPCIHDPAFVEQQLWVFLILWLSFLLFSVLWVLASNHQNRYLKNDELGFSLALRQWARKDRIAIIINRPLQLLASFGIWILLINRCNILSVDAAEYYIGLFLYAVCFVDTIIRFCAAKQKITFALSPYTILDILCLASYFCVGFAPAVAINGKQARTWLDFSIMRSIFIYRSYMEMESHFDTSTRGIMLLRQAIRCFFLLVWAGSVVFFFEMTGEVTAFTSNGFGHLYACPNGTLTAQMTDTCGSETWSMMFAIYFTVVTLATVGYGDNAPHTLESRLLVMTFILAGIVLFSMEIQNIVNLYHLRQIGNPPYRPKNRMTQHIVLMGNPTFPQLSATLRELFHPDHFQGDERKSLHVVVLGDPSSQFAKGLIHRIESEPKFASMVTYVAGDPTNDDDLERAKVKHAIGVMFLPDKLAPDAVKEDARNIMHILSVKQFAGQDFPCWAIALRNDNVRHMLAAGVERDSIVCEETMKLGVMARSCTCPGYSTLLSNLSSCLSLDKQSTTNAALGFLKANAHLGDVHVSGGTGDHEWMDHYYEGASREFYVVSLNKDFANLTFSEAAQKIFELSNGAAVLIAVEVVVDDAAEYDNTSDVRVHGVRVVLNPGHAMRLKEGTSVYVIAEDLASVEAFHITADADVDGGAGVSPVTTAPPPAFDLSQRYLTPSDLASVPETATKTPSLRSLRAPLLAQDGQSSSSSKLGPSLVDGGTAAPPQRFRDLLSGESINLDSTLERMVSSTRTIRTPSVVPPRDGRRYSLERTRDAIMTHSARELKPPPLHVLQDPSHIVICSFLGEESLAALQWFIAPLRGVFSLHMPPITILDATPPTGDWVSAIARFSDVYYVCGSPLVYQELQRAGAKAAHSVLVLAKKTRGAHLSNDGGGNLLETSMVDADAIFTTMLVDLKMDPSKMFTLTELTDESNSKLLNKKFLLQQATDPFEKMHSMWDIALSTFSGVYKPHYKKHAKSIFSMPLYMSGRLMHPQFCENLLVQAYYNPSIHRIMRQLVGGPRSTGIIAAAPLAAKYRQEASAVNQHPWRYGTLFHDFAAKQFPGVLLGVYRQTTASDDAAAMMADDGSHPLPTVLACPVDSLAMRDTDVLYILYGWNVLEDAAAVIQQRFRAHRRRTKRYGTIPRTRIQRRKTTLL
ncbi:Aste57867_11662 [Aphanomyces stellatus]|uniref:Aste57867_11662 protein n=1 Tax=Aphanomyces stellatus TaxID=120398 RepID=A0A485KTL0_9STRA|nr:hypothetical protein As57867_011619 [Aphanomyces stellatus]VFT88520.1 Aste57867_11662 [Aphanomyces stellatus]